MIYNKKKKKKIDFNIIKLRCIYYKLKIAYELFKIKFFFNFFKIIKYKKTFINFKIHLN